MELLSTTVERFHQRPDNDGIMMVVEEGAVISTDKVTIVHSN